MPLRTESGAAQNTRGNFMPTIVNINKVIVFQQSANSTVSSGENLQFGWSSSQKTVSSINNVGIANVVLFTLNYIVDNDVFDTPITNQAIGNGYMT